MSRGALSFIFNSFEEEKTEKMPTAWNECVPNFNGIIGLMRCFMLPCTNFKCRTQKVLLSFHRKITTRKSGIK